MINKCVMCGNENVKKIIVNVKIKNGFKPVDKIYLCENCLNKVVNNTDIIWYYLWKNKVGDVNGTTSKM